VDTPAVSARLIGAIFVEKGLITDAQLAEALEQQRETGERVGEILVSRFGVSRLALASALAEQWAEFERPAADEPSGDSAEGDLEAVSAEWPSPAPAAPVRPRRPIGEIFLERGQVTDEQLDAALAEQAESGRRLGEILVEQGVVSRLELASALADQWASLQKLRPPSPSGEEEPKSSSTPEAPVQPAETDHAPARVDDAALEQIRAELDVLSARLESGARVAEETAALEARIEALEAAAPGEAALDDLRRSLASLRHEVESLTAGAGASRGDELEPLIERMVALEQRLDDTAVTEALRARIDGLAARIAAVPQFDDAELVARLDAVEGRLQAAAATAAELDERVRNSLAGATDGLHAAVDELRAQVAEVDATAGGIDELRNGLAGLEERLVDAAAVREELEGLAARVDGRAEPLESALAELAGRVEEAAVVRSELAELRTRLDEVAAVAAAPSGVGEVELEELRNGLAGLEERLVDAAAVREELEGLAARVDGRAEPLESALAELAGRVEEAAVVRSELAELRTRLEEIAVAAAAGLRNDIEALAARVEEVATRSAEAPGVDPSELERLESALDRLTAQREQAETFLQERIVRLEEGVEDEAHIEERLRAELVPLVREANDETHRRLRELAARVDETARITGALDAVSERVRRLESGATQADGIDARVHELAEALESSAAALRADQIALREQLDRQLRAAAAADDIPTRVGELEERLSEASSLEARLQESLRTLQEQLTAAGRAADEEIRESLTALADDAGRIAAEGQAALAAQLEELERRIAAVAPLADRLSQVELRMGASESLGSRIDELEQRVDQGAEVEERLRAMLTPLAEASEAIRADQSALRERLGKAFTRLSSLDGIAGRLAELEQRLAEGAELETRLEESLGGSMSEAADALRAEQAVLHEQIELLAGEAARARALADRLGALEQRQNESEAGQQRLHDSAAELVRDTGDALRSEQAVLQEQIELLAQEAAASRALAGRLAALEQWQGACQTDQGRLQEALEQHASALRRLDEIDPLGSRVDAIAERLAGVEARAASGTALDELAARVAAESDAVSTRTEELRGELQELRTQLGAEISAAGERAMAEAYGRTAEALRQQAERLDDLDARLAATDVRAELVAQGELLEEGLAKVYDRVAKLERTGEKASEEAGRAVSSLRAELTERSAEAEELLRARVEEIEQRLEAAGEASAALAARTDAAEDAAAKRLTRLGKALEKLESTIEDGASRAEERSAAVEQALADRLDSQAQALDELAARTAAQAGALDSLAIAAEERDAASIDERDELREQVERLASSLGWRLERVEETLARDATEELRASVEELSRRLEEQAALSEEQVRVTEKALRKGLKSLASQLAASEDTYVAAGDALRRSIERLGRAVEDADRRGPGLESGEPSARETPTYLAFAPTGDGYRLVEVDGTMPGLGDDVTVPEIEWELRATRIGASPLPLDDRPCVYLERRPAE
jgi:DNA repair exonuclease SbcCD ATPase subunit